MSVFKTQSLLTLTLETNYDDLASAEVKKILYTKPDGTKSFWVATASGTTLVYSLSNGDIDQQGLWLFQAYIEVGGLKGFGSIARKQFDTSLV